MADRMHGVTLLLLLSTALASTAACGPSAPPPRRPPPRDRSLSTLDDLLVSPAPSSGSGEADLKSCLRRVEERAPCGDDAAGAADAADGTEGAPREARRLPIRLGLDPRYMSQWGPRWRERLDRTVACVNRLYAGSEIGWRLASVTPWDPGQQRHALYGLLDRLQRELPSDGKSLVLGITVWDKRRVYSQSGGEIGLSQRAACVVPSWPRVENDCLILAHELGHLVGARHVPGKEWIMGWAARPFHLPAADPVARVVALYRFHPRNLEAMRLHGRLGRFTPRGFRLPAACQQRVEAIDRCWRLR